MGEERRHGGGNERLLGAAADDERAFATRANEDLGLIERHRDEREEALELPERLLHGRRKVAVVLARDQLGDHLGVGLRAERYAGPGQAIAQADVVLDDPVDDDVNSPRRVAKRVRILLGDGAVRCPAGMGDADRCRRDERVLLASAASRWSRFPTARTARIVPSERTDRPALS